MGKLSEQMLEQSFLADFWMNCPNCNADVSGKVTVPEPSWNDVEDISELQSEGFSELVCDKCDKPFGCHIYFTHGDCTASLVDHPEIELHVDQPRFWPPEPDWFFDAAPSDPYGVYTETVNELRNLLYETDSDDGANLINRMCFAQAVSAFEAYLSDTLVSETQTQKKYLIALIDSDTELQAEKVSLKQALEEPDLVINRVVRHLRGLLYHNLPRIDPLFQATTNASVFINTNKKQQLMRIMADRHDCVHRNGKKKDGEGPSKYTRDYVLGCLADLTETVSHIEQAIEASRPELEIAF